MKKGNQLTRHQWAGVVVLSFISIMVGIMLGGFMWDRETTTKVDKQSSVFRTGKLEAEHYCEALDADLIESKYNRHGLVDVKCLKR